MKKNILTILVLLVSTALSAQKSVGVRGAFSASTVTKFDLIENITPKFRFSPSGSFGVFMELPIDNNFSIQPELNYTQKGFMIQEGIKAAGQFAGVNIPINGKVNFRTHYVELPVLAKLHIGNKNAAHYYMMVGPAIGVLADANMRIRVLNIFPINSDLPQGIFKPVEFSAIAALGFELPVSNKVKIFTEGRYQHGFSRILDTPIVQLPVRNRTFSGGMGIKLAI